MSEGKSKSFLAGATLGAMIGAALALLYAPQTGEKTRAKLKSQGEELKKKMSELQADLTKEGGLLETVNETLSHLSEEGEGMVQKVREEVEKKKSERPTISNFSKSHRRFFKRT